MTLSPRLRRTRRIVLFLAITAYLLSYFHRIAPAVISTELATSFHTKAASLGLLAAAYFYIYMVMQIPTGILADTLGPRKILTIGGLVAGIGSLFFGTADIFSTALIGRTLVGLGVSVIFIAMLKLIAVWYDETKFATYTGIAMFLGNTGSVIAGMPLAWLVQATGWRSIFIATGVISILIALASWSFVKDYPPTPITHKALQENVIQRPSWIKELFTVLRNSATWPGFFFNIGVAGSFFSFAGLWAGPYLMQAHGFSKIVASNHISLYFIGFAVGSIVIGRMSDYIGRRKPLLLGGSFLYSLSWLIWIFGKGLPLPITYLTFVFMGLMTSCFTLSWSCAKEVNPPALSGMATSVVNTGMFLGTAIMQPIFGWILDHYWLGIMSGSVRMYSEENFRMGLWFLFFCSLLSTFVGFLIKETYCRNVWTSLESGYKGGQQ